MPGPWSVLSIQIYGDDGESSFYIICSKSSGLSVYLSCQEWQVGFISGAGPTQSTMGKELWPQFSLLFSVLFSSPFSIKSLLIVSAEQLSHPLDRGRMVIAPPLSAIVFLWWARNRGRERDGKGKGESKRERERERMRKRGNEEDRSWRKGKAEGRQARRGQGKLGGPQGWGCFWFPCGMTHMGK